MALVIILSNLGAFSAYLPLKKYLLFATGASWFFTIVWISLIVKYTLLTNSSELPKLSHLSIYLIASGFKYCEISKLLNFLFLRTTKSSAALGGSPNWYRYEVWFCLFLNFSYAFTGSKLGALTLNESTDIVSLKPFDYISLNLFAPLISITALITRRP